MHIAEGLPIDTDPPRQRLDAHRLPPCDEEPHHRLLHAVETVPVDPETLCRLDHVRLCQN
jgi:hypothetical protein